MLTTETLDHVGDLVSTIGSDRFGLQFYRMFSDLLRIEECTVFSFPASDTPKQLVIEGDTASGRDVALALASDYVAGGYRGDPNVRRAIEGSAAIYAVCPDEIGDDDYRRHYYDRPKLAHELVMLGRTGGTLYYLSFYRREADAGFGSMEIATMGMMANIVLKALHRHSELTLVTRLPASGLLEQDAVLFSAEAREKSLDHMKDVLLSSRHGLSPREAEICAGIILGYSALAISLNCGISPATVATHRKRAYAKLGICSQNELFTRYFATVRAFEAQRLN